MYNRLCFPYEDENSLQLFESINEIYDLMLDDISKEVYINRILYSMTNNQLYAKNIILTTKSGFELERILTQAKGVYCYGAGIRGTRLVKMFPTVKWRAFVDQKCIVQHQSKLQIMNIEELKNVYQADELVVISNLKDDIEIKNELISNGVSEEKIIVLNELDKESGKNIYIDSDFVFKYVNDKTSFVDIGSFDGKDAINFKNAIRNFDAELYAFEPNPINYLKCKESLKKYSKSVVYNIGVGERATSFNMSGDGEMAHLSECDNSIKVKVDTLDKLLDGKNVGFIKMDVEGFELACLKGAKKIITEQKPIIAASVYHKMSDIVNIPQILLLYNPNYKFYMRHYSVSCADTVLYAV